MLDQGAKLAVAHFYEDDIVLASESIEDTELWRTHNTFHIHPVINDAHRQELMQEAMERSLSIKYLMFRDIVKAVSLIVTFNLLIYFGFRFLAQVKIKRHPKLISGIICLNLAAGICSGIIDRLFWGGSLDFMCISGLITEQAGDHYHAVPYHFIFDIKDVYLWIGGVLLALLIILFCIDYFKLSKDEKKELEKGYKNQIMKVFKKNRNKGCGSWYNSYNN